MNKVLEVKNLSLAFGGLKALSEFHLTLQRGQLQGLIGPNGAGKTTVFNLLTGIYTADTGDVHLLGQALRGKRPHEIAAAGVARTFQNIRLFGDLTVLDNVKIACHVRATGSMRGALVRSAHHVGEERAIAERSRKLLELFELDRQAGEQASSLPYGAQRRLEIARALATEPVVLLLDEPAAGMNTSEKRALKDLISRIRTEFGVTIFLIEHDMGLVMDICEHITVLDHGVTIALGAPTAIQTHPEVIKAYLGVPLENA